MVRYYTTIDRENCITCCTCHTNCPEASELNPDDDLPPIKGAYRPDEAPHGEEVVPDALEECVRLTEDLCPAKMIHVEEQD